MGRVALVGAGPGDPELLTVRAERLVRRADVVVADALVDRRVLALASAGARVLDVGKRPGQPFSQPAINQLLVDLAAKHELVVRLKGGDPFLFGRGGEELEALLGAGVPVEVVPGVPSPTAAGALAGVPVTHRGLADGFLVITGRRHADAPLDYDWAALVASKLTIVVLMGAASRGAIAEGLLRAGAAPSTPVAVVTAASWVNESVHFARLDELAELPVRSPATIIIGPVATPERAWRSRTPLAGLRVLVTRPQAEEDTLVEGLVELGARVLWHPAIELGDPSDRGAALEAALRQVETYDWLVVTSKNAVGRVLARIGDLRRLAHTKLAAIGPATAEALRAHLLGVDLVPEAWVGEGLAASFPKGTGRVLLARARVARDVVPEALRAKGWRVDVVEAYETRVAARTIDPELASLVDLVVFTAPSTVEGFATQFPDVVPRHCAAIGPVTEATLRRRGWPIDVVARRFDATGLLEAIRAAVLNGDLGVGEHRL